MPTAIMPEGRQRYFNNDGTPCAGGQLWTYAAGTTNPKATYADEAGTVPNPNPIPLDAKGEAVIFWSGAYKVDLQQADGEQVTGYPVDNLKTDPAGTWLILTQLASIIGASLIGFLQAGVGAVKRTIMDKLFYTVDVRDFGAKGDGVADDAPAIQAAIDYMCNRIAATAGNGGGTVRVPYGKYRLAKGLRAGNGLKLKGDGSGGYPFLGAQAKASILYADFGANVNQWAIDSATYMTATGNPVAYNEWVDGSVDTAYNSLHQIQIEGINIIDANASAQTLVPYGAMRLVGCPNAIIRDVSILGFGVGIALNTSFGTIIDGVTSLTNYYGLLCYNANNGIRVRGQFDKIIDPANLAVPVDRVPSWMPSAAAFAGDSFKMSNTHYQSSKGVVIAAAQAVGSNGANINVIAEYWDDSTFLYNSYATTFEMLYVEGASTDFVISSAYANFNVVNLHNFCGNSYLLDAGYNSVGHLNINGNNQSPTFAQNIWGSASPDDNTAVTVNTFGRGPWPTFPRLYFMGPGTFSKGIALGQQTLSDGVGVRFPTGQVPSSDPNTLDDYEETAWVPAVSAAAGAITTVGAVVGTATKIGSQVTVNFDVKITTNGTGAGYVAITNLPYAIGPSVMVSASGREVGVTGKSIGGHVSLGEPNKLVLFFYDGTYPGADGARIVGSLTYQS